MHEFDKNSDGRLDLSEFALLLRKLRALQGLDPASTTASLRASFRAYDSRGVGSISVADVRPALMRSGIDTTSGVAVAIFGSLSDQPKTAIDFAQFQRIAHAITSSGAANPPGVPSGVSSTAVAAAVRPSPASPYGAPTIPGRTSSSAADRPAYSYPPQSAYPPSAPYPSAYPPGYQPTELGGPKIPTCGGTCLGPPSFSPGGGCGGAGASSYSSARGSPDKRAAAEDARRLARRPTVERAGGSLGDSAGPTARRKL